jgi:hypothetical protein
MEQGLNFPHSLSLDSQPNRKQHQHALSGLHELRGLQSDR